MDKRRWSDFFQIFILFFHFKVMLVWSVSHTTSVAVNFATYSFSHPPASDIFSLLSGHFHFNSASHFLKIGAFQNDSFSCFQIDLSLILLSRSNDSQWSSFPTAFVSAIYRTRFNLAIFHTFMLSQTPRCVSSRKSRFLETELRGRC